MLSYKKLITLNKQFADNHYVIKNFGNGERWQIVDHDQTPSFKYPLMFVEDLPFSGQTKEFTYTLRCWFVTRVEAPTDRGDELLYSEYATAKSSMVQCALDLVSYWVQDTNYSSLEIDKNFNIETFIDKTKDRDTGCYIDLRFRDVFNYDSCIIPMDGVAPPPSSECSPVSVTINGGDSQSVASGGSLDISVHDTADNDIGTVSGSEVEISDTTLTVNGSSITNVKAEGTKAITIRYADDSPVTVTTVTDTESVFIGEVPNTQTPINVANTIKTGITTSFYANDDGATQRGRLTDFTTLDYTNPFGNTNRFTDDLGGQTYTSDVVIDWAFYNQLTGNVHGWKRTMQPQQTQADHMAGVPYTFAGYSDWTIPNINELSSLAFIGSTGRDYLNYAPFNLAQGSDPTNYLALWSSSRLVGNSAYLLASLPIAITNWFTSRKAILFRIYSLTDLGL